VGANEYLAYVPVVFLFICLFVCLVFTIFLEEGIKVKMKDLKKLHQVEKTIKFVNIYIHSKIKMI